MNIMSPFGRAKNEKDTRCMKDSAWQINRIENGLAAHFTNMSSGRITGRNNKIPLQYFEFNRIFGQGAYNNDGFLKVMEMFDELKDITPKTRGFIFGEYAYLYHAGGILKKELATGKKNYYSEKTLRNENLAIYFQLDMNYETNSDRQALLTESTEQ